MAWKKYKLDRIITERPPNEGSYLSWIQREVVPFLANTRKVLNWAIDYLGKIGIDATDTPGIAEDKLVGGTGITVTKSGAEGSRILTFSNSASFPGFYEDDPEPLGTADPGDSPLVSHGDHIHPAQDPVVEGSYLYSAFVRGSVWTECETWFGGYIYGYLQPWNPATGAWVQIAPGKWRTPTYIDLTDPSMVSAYFDGVTPTLNMRVFAHYSMSSPYRMYDGVYTVTNLGGVADYGEVTRATDADNSSEWLNGKQVKVTGGNSATDHVFRYNGPDNPTLDTDYLTFEDLGIVDPPAGDSYPALTAAQLTTESAYTGEATDGHTFKDTDGTVTFKSGAFYTLAGTPGASEVPAGNVVFTVKYVASGGDEAATTTITCTIYQHPTAGSDAEIISATSEALIMDGEEHTTQFSAYLDPAFSLSPSDTFLWEFTADTDSTTDVSVTLYYNTPSRTTKVKLPMQFAVLGGTNVHNELLGLQGGSDGDDEFYHLTADEHSWLLAVRAEGSYRYMGYQLLTTGTSWTCPDYVDAVEVICVGGGGQGGGANASSGEASVGSGGGAGGVSVKLCSVSPGYAKTYSIGAGGTGASAGANGTDGGATNWDSGQCVGYGGKGGVRQNSGTAFAETAGGLGGILSDIAGGQGGPAWTFSGTRGRSGDGAGSPLGGGCGGQGHITLPATGTDGNAPNSKQYGAGGSGAAAQDSTIATGGAGCQGCIILRKYAYEYGG